MYSICTYRSMCPYQVEYDTIINPVPLICKYFFLCLALLVLLFGFIVAFIWLYWCISSCFLFVCFVALCPKSTAMVIAGRSVHLTTLFPGQA